MSEVIQITGAAVAVMAAGCWVVSAQSETKATEESAVGPGWDGNLVGKNAKGHPIHLIPTLEAQAKWNSRAAWFAAAAALCRALQLYFHIRSARGLVPEKIGGLPQLIRFTIPVAKAPPVPTGSETAIGDVTLTDFFLRR